MEEREVEKEKEEEGEEDEKEMVEDVQREHCESAYDEEESNCSLTKT